MSGRTDLEILGCCALWARFAGLCDFVLQHRSCPMWCSESHSVYSLLLGLALNPATTSQQSSQFYCQFQNLIVRDQLLWISGVFVQPEQTGVSFKTSFDNQDTCSVMYQKLYIKAPKHTRGIWYVSLKPLRVFFFYLLVGIFGGFLVIF